MKILFTFLFSIEHSVLLLPIDDRASDRYFSLVFSSYQLEILTAADRGLCRVLSAAQDDVPLTFHFLYLGTGNHKGLPLLFTSHRRTKKISLQIDLLPNAVAHQPACACDIKILQRNLKLALHHKKIP